MNAREKGKRGERQWRDELRANGYHARRGQQFSGSPDSPDVVCDQLAWAHFEVKAVERLNIEEAMKQARRDCGDKVPILAHKRNFRPWLVTLTAEVFFQFLRGTLPPEEGANKATKANIMKIKTNSGNFQTCPEYTGPAVCVDSTPLKTVQTQYGPKEKTRFVFEIGLLKEDGTPWCVWSAPFTPSYHENSALRPFLRKWMGRELTADEAKEFDLETLLGRPAHITVIHEHSEGEVYANIALIQPDKAAETLKPSGKFVRMKDRPAKNAGGYHRAEQAGDNGRDLGATKIHVGKCKGLEVRDLAPQQVGALIEHWLPTAKANAKPTADDRRLVAALEWWQTTQSAATPEDDNVQY